MGTSMILAKFFAAVGDELTLRIASLLATRRMAVHELADVLQISQPRISHKLAKLRKYGFVENERDQRCVYYALAEPYAATILAALKRLGQLQPDCLAQLKEDRLKLVALSRSKPAARAATG